MFLQECDERKAAKIIKVMKFLTSAKFISLYGSFSKVVKNSQWQKKQTNTPFQWMHFDQADLAAGIIAT